MTALSSEIVYIKVFTLSFLSVYLMFSFIGKIYRCKKGMDVAADMNDITTVHLRTSPERSFYWKKPTDFVSVAETSKDEVKDNFNLSFYLHTF